MIVDFLLNPLVYFCIFLKLFDKPIANTHLTIDNFANDIVNQIVNKNVSDFEFRVWLRDNLSTCGYQVQCEYVEDSTSKDDTISVLDNIIFVN